MKSGPVQAFINVLRLFLLMAINGSRIGYFSLPQQTKCSSICGVPLLLETWLLKLAANTLLISSVLI